MDRPHPFINARTFPPRSRSVHTDEERLRELMREEMTQALTSLGFDGNLIEMQKDMAYLRTWRKAMQAGTSKAATYVFMVAVVGVVAAVAAALGFKLPWHMGP